MRINSSRVSSVGSRGRCCTERLSWACAAPRRSHPPKPSRRTFNRQWKGAEKGGRSSQKKESPCIFELSEYGDKRPRQCQDFSQRSPPRAVELQVLRRFLILILLLNFTDD